MIEALHYSAAGAKREAKFALPAEYFDGTVNEPVLHQAVKVYLNNQRQGTHMTKTRSFVSGGNQKPWKQKGTGRARQGSTRAPHWRGGGIVFGPSPRDYRTDIPRKVKQLARRSALNARAREGAVHVVERLAFRAPKTAQLVELLGSLGVAGRKALILTAGHNLNAYLSGRNLPRVEVMAYPEASAYHILWSDVVVVEEGALTGVMPEPLAEETEAEKAARTGKTGRAGKTGRTTVAKTVSKKAPKAKAPKKEKPVAKAKAPKVKAVKKTTAKKSADKPAKKAPKKKGSK